VDVAGIRRVAAHRRVGVEKGNLFSAQDRLIANTFGCSNQPQMAKNLSILLVVLSLGCVQRKATMSTGQAASLEQVQDSSFHTFTLSRCTVDRYDQAKQHYQDKMLYDTAVYGKKDGVVKLPITDAWRSEIVYKDSLHGEESSREYQYLGQYDTFGLYVVDGSFYEFYECYLIDRYTGNETILWSIPALSTNNTFFANLSIGYGLEGMPNGLQVWQVTHTPENSYEPIKVEKHIEMDQRNWIPTDFVWESDSSLILQVTPIEKYWEDNKPFFYLELKL
jgi:hypothetical protein